MVKGKIIHIGEDVSSYFTDPLPEEVEPVTLMIYVNKKELLECLGIPNDKNFLRRLANRTIILAPDSKPKKKKKKQNELKRLLRPIE